MHPNPTHALTLAALAALLAGAPAAQAGRPLATDDAATTPAGECLLEAWWERAQDAQDAQAAIVAPACGVAEGLELGADLTLPRPREPVRLGAGLALKWVPPSWGWQSPWGEVSLGLKAATGFDRPAGEGWASAGHTLLGLASWAPRDGLRLHANLGQVSDAALHEQATVLNLASTWSPADPWLLFAELLANDRRRLFGGVARTGGVRWWLTQDTLGLDLTLTRINGTADSAVWSLGLGWYGLGN